MPQRTIGLALSGGGFRATFYHLGVVRFLRDHDLLKEITVVSSVSGGSVLSALMATNWDRLINGTADFESVFEPLKRLTNFDLRNKQTRLLPWQILMPFFFKSGTTNAAHSYDVCLFGGANPSISALKTPCNGPQFYLMASDLNNPGCLFSFSNDGVRFHFENGETKHVTTTAPKLSTAIAASAAFPPFFVPLEVTADTLGCTEKELPYSPISLTDGGVYDNSGVVVLRRFLSSSYSTDVTIVSDASRSLDLERESRYVRSRRETFLRVVDSLQTRLANEIASSSPKNEHWVRITGQVDASVECTSELKNDIALIRTDLDVFTEGEMAALIHLGYAHADHQLQSLITTKPSSDKLRPFCQEVAGLLPQRLTESARVRIKWFGWDLATFLNLILLLTLIASIYLAIRFTFFHTSNVPGVTAYYPESLNLQPDLGASISTAQHSILMAGTHFNISLDQRQTDMLEALKRGVNITVIVLDPNSPYFDAAAANVGNNASDLRQKCDASLTYFRTLERSWRQAFNGAQTGKVGTLTLQYMDVPFVCRYYAIDAESDDGQLFVNPYIDRLRSIESPAYKLDLRSKLAKKYIQSIKATIQYAKPAPETSRSP